MERERIKDLKAIIEVLIIAEGREKRSHDFYLKSAMRTQNLAANKILLALAEEENQHRQEIERKLEEFKAELEKIT